MKTIKTMNFGTPQEMIDEERDFYESIGKKPPEGCLYYLIYVLIVSAIGLLIIFL